MPYYKVTLNMGRTDTIFIEADSVTSIREFFTSVSKANITQIKKILVSRDFNLNYTKPSSLATGDFYTYIKALCKTDKGFTGAITINFLDINATKDSLVSYIKKYLKINGDKITSVISIQGLKG
jgi:hypothetical protein